MFRKKLWLWTFISDMNGSKTQVGYIMVNKKWKNSVKNCEAYSSFSSMGSDHRIMTARLKLELVKLHQKCYLIGIPSVTQLFRIHSPLLFGTGTVDYARTMNLQQITTSISFIASKRQQRNIYRKRK